MMVCAPGAIPRQPGDGIKTDTRDALKLARSHAAGQLRPVVVPAPELEGLRDLVPRARICAVETLRRRQVGQPAAAIDAAWRAQLRLHRRWAHLDAARAKKRTTVAVAVARELARFVWEIVDNPTDHDRKPSVPGWGGRRRRVTRDPR